MVVMGMGYDYGIYVIYPSSPEVGQDDILPRIPAAARQPAAVYKDSLTFWALKEY